MKLNSAQLEAFLNVAKTLNFTRAAEMLNVTQSALSQRISNLEADLETTLFIRAKKSVHLTESGTQLLRFCQLAESAESELLDQLKNKGHDLAGIVRIAGFSSVTRSILIPALKNLMINNNRLSMQIMTKEIHQLEALLKSSEADYILTNKKSPSPDIENVFLGYEENVLVKSKKISNVDFILDHDDKDLTTQEYLMATKSKTKVTRRRYLDDIYGLIDGVKYGFGFAVLPLHLIEQDKDLEIVDKHCVLRTPVYLQFYSQPYYRKVHKDVLSDLQKHFQKVLPQK